MTVPPAKTSMPPLAGSSKRRYPINNAADLKNAIRATGRTPGPLRPAVRKHIIAEAKRLGQSAMIPATWKADGTLNMSTPITRTRLIEFAEATGDESLINLGADGAKWKHGWIPLNAAAVAQRAKWAKAGLAPGGEGPSADAKKASNLGRKADNLTSATGGASSNWTSPNHEAAGDAHRRAAEAADDAGMKGTARYHNQMADDHYKVSNDIRGVGTSKQAGKNAQQRIDQHLAGARKETRDARDASKAKRDGTLATAGDDTYGKAAIEAGDASEKADETGNAVDHAAAARLHVEAAREAHDADLEAEHEQHVRAATDHLNKARRALSTSSAGKPNNGLSGHTDGDIKRLHAWDVSHGNDPSRMATELRARGYTQNPATGKWSKPK